MTPHYCLQIFRHFTINHHQRPPDDANVSYHR